MVDPSKMTVAQLKEELDARGLSTTGKKEELKERLIEALDANEAEEEEEDRTIRSGTIRKQRCVPAWACPGNPRALSSAVTAKTDPTRKTKAPQPPTRWPR